MIEYYFKKVYNTSQGLSSLNWNVVITDTFPFWLNNTNFVFDSNDQHLDVYLLTTPENKENQITDLTRHQDDILVDDDNSSSRLNHIMLHDIGDFDYTKLPTFKKTMSISESHIFGIFHILF